MKSHSTYTFLILILIISGLSNIKAQLWNPSASAKAPSGVYSDTRGAKMTLDLEMFKNRAMSTDQSVNLSLPLPSAEVIQVVVHPTEVLAEELTSRYPGIKTWKGNYNGHPIYVDYGTNGFHAMMLLEDEVVYIDPVSQHSDRFYKSYYRNDFKGGDDVFNCSFNPEKHLPKGVEIRNPTEIIKKKKRSRRRDDTTSTMKTFRLALACTGEYAQFHGGDTANVLSAMTTSINRVNGIYERELGVRMEIIPKNTDIIFLDASTDPYDNFFSFNLLQQNQTVVDNRIGSANYDIGHVFSTGGGGVASLESVCREGSKARGVTGRSAPIGDPFDIDYVAHEMGHQFGGTHCFNNSCNGNRTNSTAFEPGSGSSIMGYAGICPPDVQGNSDALFHGGNIVQMSSFIMSLNCPEVDSFINAPPALNMSSEIYIIPARTPFFLEVNAEDSDGDSLTYSWEQYDVGIADMPPAGSSQFGPLFRGYLPTSSPRRYFPKLISVINNADPVWEELPAVSRNMEFGVTVRDNHLLAPRTSQLYVDVESHDTGEKFRILSPSEKRLVPEESIVHLKWAVAGTDSAPISTPEVDILLMDNSSFTIIDTIASGVENNGSYEFTLDTQYDIEYRIVVQGRENIFYAISKIVTATKGMDLSLLNQGAYKCPGIPDTVAVKIPGLYGEEIDININNLPQGLTYELLPELSFGKDTVKLILRDTATVDVGYYTVDVVLAVAGVRDTISISYEIGTDDVNVPGNFQVTSSGDNLLNIQWDTVPLNNINYQLQMSDSPDFEDILFNEVISDTTAIKRMAVKPGINYLRLRAVNVCTSSEWVTNQLNVTCGSRNLLSDSEVEDENWTEQSDELNGIIRKRNGNYIAFIGTNGGENKSTLVRKIDLGNDFHTGSLIIPFKIRRSTGSCTSNITFTIENKRGEIIAFQSYNACLPDGRTDSVELSLNCAAANDSVRLIVNSNNYAFSDYYMKLQSVNVNGCKTQCNLPLSPTVMIPQSTTSASCIFIPNGNFQYLVGDRDSMIAAINPESKKIGSYEFSVHTPSFPLSYVTEENEAVQLLNRAYTIDNIEDCSSRGTYTARLFFTEQEFQNLMLKFPSITEPEELGVSLLGSGEELSLNTRSKTLLSVSEAEVDLPGYIKAIDVEVPRRDGELIIHSSQDTLADLWLKLNAQSRDSTILVQWEVDVELGVEKLYLQRSTDKIEYQNVDTTTFDGSENYPLLFQYRDYNIDSDEKYYYRVEATYFDRESRYSLVDSASLDPTSTAGLQLREFNLFPNPHNNIVTFKHETRARYTIEIYNMQGILIDELNYRNDHKLYRSSALQPGIYYIQLFKNGEYRGTTSMIKM